MNGVGGGGVAATGDSAASASTDREREGGVCASWSGVWRGRRVCWRWRRGRSGQASAGVVAGAEPWTGVVVGGGGVRRG